ncbi:hypothetical protein [Geodermatophilus pulveris]|nr:hypothetical protein [Geodermatophilus pulveris]
MVAWMVGGLVVWMIAALVVGVLLGRGIRLADVRDRADRPLTTADQTADAILALAASRR